MLTFLHACCLESAYTLCVGTLVKKKSFPFEEVAQLADKLLESFPASKLSALGHRLMSTYLSPARYADSAHGSYRRAERCHN